MNQFILADPEKCIGCRTCEVACMMSHQSSATPVAFTSRIRVVKGETFTTAVGCHQCEDAPCAAVCPVNAINRVDGAVQLNESLCVSCKLCGIACPFGAIEFSGSRPLDMPANANTPLAPAAPPAPRLGAGRARHRRQMRPVPLR